MRRYLFFYCFLSFFTTLCAQVPAGYYQNADGKKGRDLQIALSNIIDGHRIVSYSSLWQHFGQTDCRNDTIIDIYSDNPGGQNAYHYILAVNQCGNVGSTEGVCYNREHSFPQSWFGGGTGAPYSDLFHIYPVDGNINSTRGNWPYGIVNSPARMFSNGSKFGPNAYPNAPVSSAFEPIDDYKGDIARSFFYMSTRYMFEDANFSSYQMTDKSQLKPWAVEMLLDWHLMDPVSEKERSRNDAIYLIQQNRNPFIDYPELAGKIWGADSVNPFLLNDTSTAVRPVVTHFSIRNSTELVVTFNMSMNATTVSNVSNYALNNNNSVRNAEYNQDTLFLLLESDLINGNNYKLILRNLMGENLVLMQDTSIAFVFGFPVERTLLLAWTFDSLAAAPLTPKVIIPDINPFGLDAALHLNGAYGASDFVAATTGNQLDAYSGTVLGDPRTNGAIAGKSLGISNTTANGASVVLRFPTENSQHLAITFACRRTASGFDTHIWEWSSDGVDYNFIEGANTIPDTTSIFLLQTLDLQTLSAVEEQDTLFLRLTLDGATHYSGNNRFDNIVIHADLTSQLEEWEGNGESGFVLYPNPSKGNMTIRLKNQHAIDQKHYILCYNMQGKLLLQKIMTGKEEVIDMSRFAPGVYIIDIMNDRNEYIGKEKIVLY